MTRRPRKLASYLQILDSIGIDDSTCYRGQADDWPIVPKIARIVPRGNLNSDEDQMLQTFKRQMPQFVDNVPDNDWDILAIAQHHGLATRLLDWSHNPLAALWFAVREPPRERAQSESFGCSGLNQTIWLQT